VFSFSHYFYLSHRGGVEDGGLAVRQDADGPCREVVPLPVVNHFRGGACVVIGQERGAGSGARLKHVRLKKQNSISYKWICCHFIWLDIF
jgi:hypothetical protein